MKRTLSVILAILLLLSALMSVPIFTMAVTSNDATFISFDTSAQQSFYSNADNIVASSDRFNIAEYGANGKAAKFTRISAGYGTRAWQGNYPDAFLINDGTENGRMHFTKGEKYLVRVAVKRVKNTQAFRVALYFDESLKTIGNTENICNVPDVQTSKVADIVEFTSAGTDDKFNYYTAVITVPSSGAAAMIIYRMNTWRTDGEEIHVDDITIAPPVSLVCHGYEADGSDKTLDLAATDTFDDIPDPIKAGYTFGGWYLDSSFDNKASGTIGNTAEVYAKWTKSAGQLDSAFIDFDTENQQTFYSSNSISQFSAVANSGDSAYENAMKVSQVHANRWYNNDRNWITRAPNAFVLPDSTYSTRQEFGKGEIVNISLELMKNSDIATTDFSSVKIGIIFGSKISTVTGENIGAITDYYNDGKLVDIGEFDLTASDWNTFTKTLTVPSSGAAAIVLYNDVWKADCEIYIDNISYKVLGVSGEEIDVTYHYNYENAVDETLTTTVGSQYDIPERTGYIFSGWYLDEKLETTADDIILADGKEVWAKWEVDTRVAQKVNNTYDEPNTAFEKLTYDNYDHTKRRVNGITEDTHFSVWGVNVEEIYAVDKKPASNAVHFSEAKGYNNKWPATARVYDNSDQNLGWFTPNPNSAYSITLKYYVPKAANRDMRLQLRYAINDDILSTTAYNESNVLINEIATVKEKTYDWIEVTAYFYTGANVKPLSLVLCSATTSAASDVDVWVDDIVITERFDTHTIAYDSNGGYTVANQTYVTGAPLDNIPIPEKDGYYFEGWFTDKEFKNLFTDEIMPDKKLKLYADWVEAKKTVTTYNSGFEISDYDEDVTPVSNNGTNESIEDNKSNQGALWHTGILNDDEPYDGKGYLSVTFENNTATRNWSSVALINKDGSYFEVVKGQRYRLKFNYKSSQTTAYFRLVISNSIPVYDLNSNNTTELAGFDYSSAKEEIPADIWGETELCFEAAETGRVFLSIYNESGTDHTVCVDNLLVEPIGQTEAVYVHYYNGSTLVSSSLGFSGDFLLGPTISAESGKSFNGWYYADGSEFVSAVYPNKDTTVYAHWVDAVDLTGANESWNKTTLIDFEDSKNILKFYSTTNNVDSQSYGLYPAIGEGIGYNGSNVAFKLDNAGHWIRKYYRSFRVFNKDSLGNLVYLEPGSVYRVTFWFKVEKANDGTLYLVAFDGVDGTASDMEKFDLMSGTSYAFSEGEQAANRGKWVQYEGTIVTGKEVSTLGFVVARGPLSGLIDNIEITKLNEVTISFDSNGGSEVMPITQLSYDYAIAPADPERKGYDFAGWYSDKACTEKFNFLKTLITENITLYAKWTPTEKQQYETVVTYTEVVKEIVNEITNAHLDDFIVIEENDAIKQVKTDTFAEKEENGFLWWIIIVIAAAVILTGGIVLLIILLKRKKKKA